MPHYGKGEQLMWTEQIRRLKIVSIIVVGIVSILVFRLIWLQLLQGAHYKINAEQNRTRQISVQAPRGVMYDRNGVIIVSNRPSFAVSVIPNEYAKPQEATPLLASITGVTVEEINQLLEDKNRNLLDQSSLIMLAAFRDGNFIVDGEPVPISKFLLVR